MLKNLCSFSCLALLAALVPTALATDGTFVGSGNGTATTANYSDTSKWTGGVVAGGTGATAIFNINGSTGAGNTAVTISSPVTLGTLQLTGSSSGQNFSMTGSGTAANSTFTWATSSGTPLLRLDTYFSKTYSFGGSSLTFAGNQGLSVNTGSNVFSPSSSGLSWVGFSGTLTVTANNNDGGTIDPQAGGTLPPTHLTLLPGTGTSSITLGMFSGRDQTIGGFEGAAATYVRNNGTSFSTLTLGTSDDSGTFAGVFGKNVGSSSTDFRSNMNINKNGLGTQTFSGTSYAGGTTTINAGTFLMNGTHSASVTASGNIAATSGTGGKYVVKNTGILGGIGTIRPFDTAGGGVMIDVQSGGALAPGDPVVNGGLGTLTLDQTNSLQSILNFSTGGTVNFRLGAGSTNSKVAVIGSSSVGTEVFFNSTGFNFSDPTSGNLTAGTYILFQGDANTSYSGNIGAISGLSNYPGSTVQVAGNNVTLTLAPASVASSVPGAPSGLTAIGGNNQISLSWTPPSTGGATVTYKVKRGTVSGSYTILAAGSVAAPMTSFVDTTAVNDTTYYYVVSASNSVGEGADSTPASATPQAPTGVGFNLKPSANTGMLQADLAGVVRLPKWNNINGPTGSGVVASLSNVVDSTGAAIGGMATSFTGGAGGPTLTLGGEPGNDATMISGAYDQYDSSAATISISGIPYPSYDLYLYMWNDGSARAGAFTVNGTTYYMRGGVGNPSSSGTGYVRSTDTTYGAGTDIMQGNYILVSGLTTSSLSCSVVAVNAGDGVQRCKFSGYQIVATTRPLVTTAPAAPVTVQVVAGNNQTTIYWSSSNTATTYYIKRSTDGVNFTVIATLDAFSTSYIDLTAANGTTYYYEVSAANGIGESANSNSYSSSPFDPQKISVISVKLQAIGTYGIAVGDLAGVPRVPYWNNLLGPTLQGETVALPSPQSEGYSPALTNHFGVAIPGMSVSFTAGNTTPGTGTGSSYSNSGTIKLATDTALTNEDNLLASVFDQYDTTPSTLNVTGIPYGSYDALFFFYDGGSARGGSVTVNGTTYFVRGGAGNPAGVGSGYIRSTGTNGGATAGQGNYVRFSGLSGNLAASLVASNLGDSTQRLKFAGFQIVSNDAYVAPSATPSVPALSGAASNSETRLNWTPSPTATSYQIYRNGNLLTSVASPLLSYADSAVTNGSSYSYTVAAVNGVGASAQSATVSLTPVQPSFTPLKRTVFQYSIPVRPVFPAADGVTYYQADPYRRAYLWVPPGLSRIQGAVVCMHNMLEKPFVDDDAIRAACANAGLAIVFISPQSAGGAYAGTSNGAPAFLPIAMALNGDPNAYVSLDISSGTTHYATDINNRTDIRNGPATGTRFANQAEQCGAELQVVLQQLAAESGYTELAYAPLLLTGHSAASTFVWVRNVPASAALAGRVFGIMPNKGTFPGNLTANSPSGNNMTGIPILHIASEWVEISTWGDTWMHSDEPSARNIRSGGLTCLLGQFIQPGTGHYDYPEPLSGPMAQFIKSAAAARIPANWSTTAYPTLNSIDPTNGYLVDSTQLASGNAQPVKYSDWVAAGKNPLRAMWYVDLASAQSVCDKMNGDAVFSNGQITSGTTGFAQQPQQIDTFNGATLYDLSATSSGNPNVSPTLQSDGITFRMQAASVNKSIVPRLFHGAPLGMSSSPTFFKANDSGSLKQVGPDTFRVWLDRGNPFVTGQPYEPFIIAVNLGDNQYRMADRPSFITTAVPVVNVTGTAQLLSWSTLPNQTAANPTTITFGSNGVPAATASSGLAPQYWVASGPFHGDETSTNGERIIPDPIPPNSKFPVRVVIGGWQWGRPSQAGSAIASAPVVFKTFWVFRDAHEKFQYENFGTTTLDGNGQQSWNPLPPSAADDADPDGDGQNNLAEFTAGTNPLSATDRLQAAIQKAAGPGFTISFPTKATHNYLIEFASSLSQPDWQPLETVPASSTDGTFQDTDPTAETRRFYRVRTPAP